MRTRYIKLVTKNAWIITLLVLDNKNTECPDLSSKVKQVLLNVVTQHLIFLTQYETGFYWTAQSTTECETEC